MSRAVRQQLFSTDLLFGTRNERRKKKHIFFLLFGQTKWMSRRFARVSYVRAINQNCKLKFLLALADWRLAGTAVSMFVGLFCVFFCSNSFLEKSQRSRTAEQPVNHRLGRAWHSNGNGMDQTMNILHAIVQCVPNTNAYFGYYFVCVCVRPANASNPIDEWHRSSFSIH